MTKPVVWSEEEMITGKKCSKCGLIKPYSNYSRNRTNKGGFSYDCTDCHLESCKKWREKNREAYKEANKRSYREKVVSGKKQAERKLHYAIDTGSIKKENCVLCGNPAEAHHHFGYDHPLEVIWLCKKHHMSHHKYIRILTEVAVQDGTKKAVFDERQAVLAEIEGWLDERWKRIFPDEYSVKKITKTAPFDSRIMGIMHENELFKEQLVRMKEEK